MSGAWEAYADELERELAAAQTALKGVPEPPASPFSSWDWGGWYERHKEAIDAAKDSDE